MFTPQWCWPQQKETTMDKLSRTRRRTEKKIEQLRAVFLVQTAQPKVYFGPLMWRDAVTALRRCFLVGMLEAYTIIQEIIRARADWPK